MILTPNQKDKAIETTCSNLVIAELLTPQELTSYMEELTGETNEVILSTLIFSHMAREEYYQNFSRSRVN
uniref:Uncharacterized protein n=1 Tax=viral metagenome TaxID=1070528 RepID=A0A6M3KYG8_9ZZZZ